MTLTRRVTAVPTHWRHLWTASMHLHALHAKTSSSIQQSVLLTCPHCRSSTHRYCSTMAIDQPMKCRNSSISRRHLGARSNRTRANSGQLVTVIPLSSLQELGGSCRMQNHSKSVAITSPFRATSIFSRHRGTVQMRQLASRIRTL
jgi:hypothetical protein